MRAVSTGLGSGVRKSETHSGVGIKANCALPAGSKHVLSRPEFEPLSRALRGATRLHVYANVRTKLFYIITGRILIRK